MRVSGCSRITGMASFEAICCCCRSISHLDLTNCSAVSDYAMIHFAENGAPMLSHILLSGCSKVTNTGIEWLVSGCPNLVLLNLKGTKVTLTSLKLLHDRYTLCELTVTKEFFGLQPRKRHLDQLAILGICVVVTSLWWLYMSLCLLTTARERKLWCGLTWRLVYLFSHY